MEKVMGYITKINQKTQYGIYFLHANNPDAAHGTQRKWKV